MTERSIKTQDSLDTESPLERAYRRIAQLHYALSVADDLTEVLHHRAIDDLMEILEILEPALPPRASNRAQPAP